MPTIADIPTYLLPASCMKEFLAWLSLLPVQSWIRRDLAVIWQRVNGITFTDADYKKFGL